MLDKVVTFLQKQLNNQLKGDSVQDRVVLAKLGKDCVHLALEAVTVILVGIEPDHISRSADPYRGSATTGGSGPVYPEIRLNLYLFLAAQFESYENALHHLSVIIRYFQHNPVLTHENAPMMHADIDRLSVELQEMPFSQHNDIWNTLKVAAVPSLLYRVRTVVFEQQPSALTPAIVETEEGTTPR